jgi:hypothetical protein
MSSDLADISLGEIQRHLHHLVAVADTAERPHPTRVNPPDHAMPGLEWVVNEDHHPYTARSFTWTIRTVDDPEYADAVFVSSPDSINPGEDFVPLTTTDARRVGLALLAAADRADHVSAGVPRLSDRRRP